MKKLLPILTVALLVTMLFPMAAFACGYGGGRGGAGTAARNYALCGVEGCEIAGTHLHDGIYYYGHYVGDGHDYHEFCAVNGCDLTYCHEHDGETYFPRRDGDVLSYPDAGSGRRYGGCCY